MNESFKLPFLFDRQKLKTDLEICQSKEWALHFNTNDFTGTWTSFALRSVSGKELDILATPKATYQNTETLEECRYFKEIIDSFSCQKEAVRLLSLSPKSHIKEHKDNDGGYEDGFFRIHVPIQTNVQVIFKVNGQTLSMQEGECWYANFNLPHYVSNEGIADRIHLVLDCIRNDWSDKLFEKLGYNFEEEKKSIYDLKTKLMMIEHLSLMGTDTAKNLIEQLKAEIDKENG